MPYEMGIWRQKQPVAGYPHGECVRTSYANLLELPLDVVPRFDPAYLKTIGKEQRAAEREWLRSKGYDLLMVPHMGTVPGNEQLEIPADLYHLMTVISRYNGKELRHRVVGRGGKVAFDPHPNNNEIVKIEAHGFLVPLAHPLR